MTDYPSFYSQLASKTDDSVSLKDEAICFFQNPDNYIPIQSKGFSMQDRFWFWYRTVWRTVSGRGAAFADLDNMERYICQFVCKLTLTDTARERNGIGSGILLGRDLVMTCQHCLPRESPLFVSFGHYISAQFTTQRFRKVVKMISPKEKNSFLGYCQLYNIQYSGDIAFLELEGLLNEPFPSQQQFPVISETNWSSETHGPLLYYGYCHGSNLKVSRKIGFSRKLTDVPQHAGQSVWTKGNEPFGLSEKTSHPEVYSVSPHKEGKPKLVWSSPEHGVRRQLKSGYWKPYADSAEFEVMFQPFVATDHFLTNLDTAEGGSGGIYAAKNRRTAQLEIVGLHIGELREMLPENTTPLHLAVFLHVPGAASAYDQILFPERRSTKKNRKAVAESKNNETDDTAESKDHEADDTPIDDIIFNIINGHVFSGVIGSFKTTPRGANADLCIQKWIVTLLTNIIANTKIKLSEESPLKSYFLANASDGVVNPTDDLNDLSNVGAYRRHYHIWCEQDGYIALQYKDTMTDSRMGFQYYLVSINLTISYGNLTIEEIKVAPKPTLTAQQNSEGFTPDESTIATYPSADLEEPILIENRVHHQIVKDILALKDAFEDFVIKHQVEN